MSKYFRITLLEAMRDRYSILTKWKKIDISEKLCTFVFFYIA